MTSKAPIGVFDSGVGGLSIWREIHRLMPAESSIYLADSANAPYGERSQDEIIALSAKNTEYLLAQGCKIIVVACNTATTNAIAHLRERYPVPFIGIEPATKPAAIGTKSGKIGILATKGTLVSELFLNTSARYRGEVEIIERVGTGLVQIIESGDLEKARPLLLQYLAPMIEAGADHIVLGCSHYPFLMDMMREILPDHVEIIDSGAPVARQTLRILSQHGLQNSGQEMGAHRFYTNGDLSVLNAFLGKLLLQAPLQSEKLAF
jgi:glutamate racemase